MTINISIHNVKSVEAVSGQGYARLTFTTTGRDQVDVFMERHEAEALAEAWAEAQREPEPPDAETIAAREHAHDDALRDAGRGHLVRP